MSLFGSVEMEDNDRERAVATVEEVLRIAAREIPEGQKGACAAFVDDPARTFQVNATDAVLSAPSVPFSEVFDKYGNW